MEVDMETSPSYFDPEDLSTRERFRRYGKRGPTSGISPHQENSSGARLLYDGQSIERRPNAALFLEDIKQEAESYDGDQFDLTSTKTQSASRRRVSIDSRGISEADVGADSVTRPGSFSMKSCKLEDDALADGGDTTFSLFASLLDSALQGLMPISDLILQFERSCRNVSESMRYASNEKHRIVEDKLMKQKAQLLLDEAASWSLLWYLYGKGNEELPKDNPTTSHLEACQFVVADHTAQLCLRIVHWLEGLASKSLYLDNKVRGSHVGTYLPSSGIWRHTQRSLKKGVSKPKTVHHLDFDAPTRECAEQLPDDKKQDESLLEDVWTLLRAGRLEEACDLCRSAGQPWRAATLCPFGGLDLFPSVEALVKNGKNRTLQAIELESGIGRQWRLWKWATYCASERIAEQDGGKYETAVYAAQCSNLKRILPICKDWESACWAMAKSWVDVQVDLELARLQPGGMNQFKSYYEDSFDGSPGQGDSDSPPVVGSESWPLQVVNQQPRHLSSLLQKLHSSDSVCEAVTRECKEQHRKIEMNLMMGDIPNLLDLIWSWISPSEDEQRLFRPHGDAQMIRFGAHLVLVLRSLLGDQMKDAFREKIMTVGDLILNMYAMFLFSKQHEELIGIYASQLARHRCIDLFVHMMELRLSSSVQVKYKVFRSAIEYLPFSPGDDSKGSFEEIIDRVLSRSREIKTGNYDKSSDIAEQHRLQSREKAMVVQWLCFTPPSTINDAHVVSSKLLFRALLHSNVLFREFALISMWRVPAMPIGAHVLLRLLAEPLKQPTEALLSDEDHDVSENIREFEDWNEYYSCDATYRKWLKVELENAEVSPLELSDEEKQRAIMAANESLNSSLSLLLRKENPWLVPNEDSTYESVELFLELRATAMLCLPSGECMCPDATLCATLMSALYSSVDEQVVSTRQLMVAVSISARDNYCIEVVLRCLATDGDGLGPHDLNDGGVLATVIAAGFKGELVRFQAGVTMEISRLDAWYSDADGSLEGPATYILRGLCRRCCIPEVILRCMQVSVSLMELGSPSEDHDQLIELVACPETGFLHLFSQQQLQEFLLFEREYSIYKMELQEELAS
ncbi:nuclear pore complex protein NUP107 isoform X2 [Rhododendron vialii]|uniref:nuclear pore complex protein NUP107 isoform X2 n=1 Tax=Rhododendron vialii TaxID=182163 RepID=UPI0026600072|nr:nuclear pore complex protein NUP107 isoform X2 [Rhododendron vialii]